MYPVCVIIRSDFSSQWTRGAGGWGDSFAYLPLLSNEWQFEFLLLSVQLGVNVASRMTIFESNLGQVNRTGKSLQPHSSMTSIG